MKRQMLVLMAAGMLLSAVPAATVHAAPEVDEVVIETIVPQYVYTYDGDSTLSFSGSTASCKSKVTGTSSCTKIVATQKLQKKVLWWWSNVETWDKTVYGTKLDMSNTATVTDSGTYRVIIEATVYAGSNSEDVEFVSPEVTK